MNRLDETLRLICELTVQEVAHYLDNPSDIEREVAHKVGIFIMENKENIVESALTKLERCKANTDGQE